MTRHNLLSAALTVLLSIGGLSLAVGAESAQPVLTKKTLKAAIAKAETPQEHQRIASYYRAKADRMMGEAAEHDELAAVYGKSGNAHAMKHPMSGQTAEHCKHFADSARQAAQAAKDLAKMHEDMAKANR